MEAPDAPRPHVHPPDASYAEDLDRLTRIAAWAGLAGGKDPRISFGTLLAAFLLADDPCSRWFQELASRFGTDVDGIFRHCGLEPGRHGEVLKGVESGSLPESSTDFITVSARGALEAGAAFAARHGERIVAARHLMVGLATRTARAHQDDLRRWKLDARAWRGGTGRVPGPRLPGRSKGPRDRGRGAGRRGAGGSSHAEPIPQRHARRLHARRRRARGAAGRAGAGLRARRDGRRARVRGSRPARPPRGCPHPRPQRGGGGAARPGARGGPRSQDERDARAAHG